MLYSSSLFYRPESEPEISRLAEVTLKKAGAVGILPTSIDDLVKAATITEISAANELKEDFFSRLKEAAQETFKYAIQKVRGIADLREKTIYIPTADNPQRIIFPKAHELGHQVLPWHNIDPAYLDDDFTLSPEVEYEFDREANFFASEVIFQGKRFRSHALDYTASLHAAFKLSDIYGASKQSTLWRYVEEQDEAVALVMYYPSENYDEFGKPYLKSWRFIPSQKFRKNYGDIKIPTRIQTGHPWLTDRDLKEHNGKDIFDGKDKFICGGISYTFEWQTWWNGYTLFVLLRRAPALGVISKILK